MKNFSMENLTELSQKELTEIQGGGVIDDILNNITTIINKIPGQVAQIGDNLKKILDWLF
jgi:hypothetical protein